MELRRVDPQELAIKFVERNLAFARAHIVEATGHNDGPFIDKLESVWGMKGEPYCGMGQYYSFGKTLLDMCGVAYGEADIVDKLRAARGFVAAEYLEFYPLVAAMVAAAKKRGQHRRLDSPHAIYPGALVFFNFGTKAKPQNHVAMATRYNSSHLWTVEWNTTPGPGAETNDPGRAGGCFWRERELDHVTGWADWVAR